MVFVKLRCSCDASSPLAKTLMALRPSWTAKVTQPDSGLRNPLSTDAQSIRSQKGPSRSIESLSRFCMLWH